MTETANLGLHVISDSAADKAMLFSTWRAKVAGTDSDSNMQIIDRAFGNVASKLAEVITEDTYGLVIRLPQDGD